MLPRAWPGGGQLSLPQGTASDRGWVVTKLGSCAQRGCDHLGSRSTNSCTCCLPTRALRPASTTTTNRPLRAPMGHSQQVPSGPHTTCSATARTGSFLQQARGPGAGPSMKYSLCCQGTLQGGLANRLCQAASVGVQH